LFSLIELARLKDRPAGTLFENIEDMAQYAPSAWQPLSARYRRRFAAIVDLQRQPDDQFDENCYYKCRTLDFNRHTLAQFG
jgi:hypothetical protein